MTKLGAIFVLALFLIGAGGSYFIQKTIRENRELRSQLQTIKEDPQAAVNDEVAELVAIVSGLIVLPQDEQPMVVTVTDKDKLKDQAVFAKAENGDKILIYTNSQKAYIYSPLRNMIVDVVPVKIEDNSISLVGVDEDNPLRLATINGSKNAGMAKALETRINEKKIAGLSVVAKITTSNSYARTLVIDLTGRFADSAKQLAGLVGGIVATQSAEATPNADVMVIIGNDFK